MNAKELMDFVISLDNRGLLSKGIDDFDYEWVIWDYERTKAEKLPIHDVVGRSEQLVCPDCAEGRDPFEPEWKCPECRRRDEAN